MHKKAQKTKSRKPKSQSSKSDMEDDKILTHMPLRSIPPVIIDNDSPAEEVPAIHNNYLPWVDYTNVREIDNPKSGMRNNADDDVGGEKSQTVIDGKENVEEEASEPIVEERVFHSLCAGVSETAGLSGPSVMTSVNDRREMDDEPSVGTKSSRDAGEGTDPGVGDMVPDTVEEPSTESLGTMEEPSVKGTLDDTAVEDDLLKTSDAYTSEAKKARKAETRARKATRKAQRAAEAQDTLEKEVEENAPGEEEVVVPPIVHTSVDDEWLPEQEPPYVNDQDEDSDDEDVDAVMEKRRKTKGKLRLNENRTRIGNRRIPKNVVVVPTTNVSLNSEEERAEERANG
ncbi:hypothetical protein LIER_27473 [Lithospermum erythrorhizon]|uniref:Uncharacterized protein n=1 Tax=Lithospermum erythrorhizon TaxID=34254 RepID=A0AAV3RDP9_LITER